MEKDGWWDSADPAEDSMSGLKGKGKEGVEVGYIPGGQR